MVSTLTARSYQINLSSKNRNLLLVISLKNPFQLLFLFPLIQEDDFPPLTNVYRPVFKSRYCSNHVTVRSIVVSPNVSGHVKRRMF